MLHMSPVNASSSSSTSQPIHSPTHLAGMFIRDDDDYGDLNVDQIREQGLGTTPPTTPISAPTFTTAKGASGSGSKDMDSTTTTIASAALPLADSDGSPRHGTTANSRSNSNSPEASPSHNSPGHNASPGSNSSPSASPGHNASPGANGSPGANASAGASPNTSPGPVASSKRSKGRHHGKGKGTDTTVLASLANDG